MGWGRATCSPTLGLGCPLLQDQVGPVGLFSSSFFWPELSGSHLLQRLNVCASSLPSGLQFHWDLRTGRAWSYVCWFASKRISHHHQGNIKTIQAWISAQADSLSSNVFLAPAALWGQPGASPQCAHREEEGWWVLIWGTRGHSLAPY